LRASGVFEELHAAVVGALVAEPIEIPGQVRVIVLPSGDLEELIGQRYRAVYWVSRLGEPTILVALEDVNSLPQVVSHELAHRVSYYLFPRQPRWFSEGLAQFLESVAKVDPDGNRWAGGDPTSGWGAGNVKLTHAMALFVGDYSGFFDDPYLTSWVVYRFLWNDRSTQFSEFQRRLSAGESPTDAWIAAFPEWNPTTGSLRSMDPHLEHHRIHSRGLRWQVKVGEVSREFTTTEPSSGDLHMILLEHQLLRTNRLLQQRLSRNVAEEVLREDQYHPLAIVERASLDSAPLLPVLRAAVASRPTDGRSWYLLARATEEPSEREAALRKAAALWAESAIAQAALASHLASTGRGREALPFANAAVELAPWNPDVVAALAQVALELGKCPEAVVLQTRAVEITDAGGVGSIASDAAALRRQLTDYRARCNAGQAGTTASGKASD
jgi:hypothetical protein